MKAMLRWLLTLPLRIAHWYTHNLARRKPALVEPWLEAQQARERDRIVQVSHISGDGHLVELKFHAPTSVALFRAETFSEKEPETLAWLDRFGGPDRLLFDIGSNIGLYSCYYAKKHSGPVIAFEPSCMNLSLLAKNVVLNDVAEQICLFTLPLAEHAGIASFNMTDEQEGSALSSFGANYGPNGQPLEIQLSYRLAGVGLDACIDIGLIPSSPALIKIDVDGTEQLILRGAKRTLTNQSLASVLIEVDESFSSASEAVSIALQAAGFMMESRQHSPMFETGPYSTSWNQIWVR